MTDLEDKNEWKNCIDITGVRLPTGYYFGASAGTGDLSGECVGGSVLSLASLVGHSSQQLIAFLPSFAFLKSSLFAFSCKC